MRERSGILGSVNRLSTERRAQILGMLVEGNTMRATPAWRGSRSTPSASSCSISARPPPRTRTTHLRDLPCKTVEADESGRSLRQAEEHARGAARAVRRRQRVDLDRDLRRHEADRLVDVGERDAEAGEVFLADSGDA